MSLDSRRRIYEFVKRQPGTHLREIARSLDLPLGTALYHLEYLEDTDHVVVRRDGRYKRFFCKHDLGRREKDYVSAFHHGVPRKIATILLATSKRTQRELAEAVGVSRSTLSFHLNKMVDGGILDCEELWPENTYEVTDQDVAARILVRYRESFSGPGRGGDSAATTQDAESDTVKRFDEMVQLIGARLASVTPSDGGAGPPRASDTHPSERASAPAGNT